MKRLYAIAFLALSVSAAQAQPTLALRADLPDGAKWILGDGGIGRPFKARLLLVNQGKESVTIWDYQNSEGAQCPGVILTDDKGKETVLRPPPFLRLAGVPSVIAIPPTQIIAIELELLRLIGERGLPPGKYRLKAFYENQLKNDNVFIKSEVWLGRIESEPVDITIVAPQQGGNAGRKPQSAEAQPKDPPKNFTNSIGMKFTWIPPGSFMMGSPKEEKERKVDETQHKVTLTKGFYLGVFHVTQEEWQALMGNNPSRFKGERLPIEQVSWDQCQEFCKKLREKDKKLYRLPSEAEFEYACRAGTSSPFHFGETIDTDRANFHGDYPLLGSKKGLYRKTTTPVGSFAPNPWGLYDMHGNVWSRCQDWYGEYPQNEVIDPQGPATGKDRVMRGGAWGIPANLCRSASRYKLAPAWRDDAIGLRVCFNLETIVEAHAGEMKDEQLLKRAVEVIAKEDPNSKVTPVQSQNPHLGPWALKNPLPEYRFFCALLAGGRSVPNRRFLAVKRTGQVMDSFDGTKFSQLLAAEDKAKWKDEDYRNAAILWVHLMARANEDGWKVLEKPEDFTRITFNMESVGLGAAKQKEAAKQIVPLKFERKDGQVIVTFYAWHLIGGHLRHWQVEIGSNMVATKQELGQFGGGGYD